MAEEVIIDVKLDTGRTQEQLDNLTERLIELARQQKGLKNEEKQLERQQSELDEAFAKGALSLDEYTTASDDVTKSLVNNNKAQKLTRDEISKVTKSQAGLIAATKSLEGASNQYGDTLNEERRKLADMQKAYAELSKTARESKFGTDLQKEIKKQHDAVLEMEKGIGDMRRNVGNYAESISQAFGNMGGGVFAFVDKLKTMKSSLQDASAGVKGFGGSLKLLGTIGVVAVITAIVAVIEKMREAFARSEQNTNKLKRAFAPLQGAVDLITKGFDLLASVVADKLVAAFEAAVKGVEWIASALDAVGSFLGQDWGLARAFESAADNTRKLQAAEEAYLKHKREFVETEANAERELAELKAKVADKDKYTASERIKFLERANDIELKLAAERKQLAKEQLAVLELDAERAENDADANDRLAEARAAVVKSETDYYNKQKELIGKLREARAAMAADQKAQLEAEKKFYDELDKERAAEIDAQIKSDEASIAEELKTLAEAQKKAEENAKKRKEALQKFGLIATPSELEAELELLSAAYDDDLLTYDEYLQAKAKINADYQAKQDREREKALLNERIAVQQEVAAYSQATSAGFQAMSDVISAFSSSASDANELQKSLAIGAIVMQEAQVIADAARAIMQAQVVALEGASAGGPAAPAIYAAQAAAITGAIVSVVSTTAASIVKAKQTLSGASAGSFNTGGIVRGNNPQDGYTARVSGGEMVLNKSQQSRLFAVANGAQSGFNYAAFADTIAAAVANVPAPVMEYSEFKRFEGRVTNYDELTKI